MSTQYEFINSTNIIQKKMRKKEMGHIEGLELIEVEPGFASIHFLQQANASPHL